MNQYLFTNKLEQNIKVINKLKECIRKTNSFFFSVAFITDSGLRLIEEELQELEKKGIKGKILASSYQSFTDPNALRKLISYSNLEIRIITEEQGNHHTKGYYFETNNQYMALIGSSNLTAGALTKNIEWNVYKEGNINDAFHYELSNEFSYLWQIATRVDDIWINTYERIYESNKRYQLPVEASFNVVVPNKMQVEALLRLESFREKGKDKALIISATGTGKTYLAAFDVKALNPKTCLFIVHRETILDSALETFKKVIPNKKMGKYTGTKKDVESDYLFATVQTLSKNDHLKIFDKHYFEYIIFDEVHHAGAKTYQLIYEHFKPKFILGMSATPDRNDGFNIYEMFDHNIAAEIRLSQAMQFDLICDFHYYGIKDIEIIDSNLEEGVSIDVLTVDERVKHVIEKSRAYGYSGTRLKGLIFCSRNEEAAILSNKLNQEGLKTVALSGKNTNEERELAIKRLEQNDVNGSELDFILTVDIFNEGVDIPSVNQIILLRQTESSIVFIQQIGRGLRKNLDKDFCVILDFIANYKTNYLISVALSGDKTYKKDTLREFIFNPTKILYGGSTIHFEEIVKNQLLENIDKTNFRNMKLLKEEYYKLKNKVGRIPRYKDFLTYEAIDLQLIIKNSDSYYNFLVYLREIDDTLSDAQKRYINLVSAKFSDGKRQEELIAIKLILEGKYTNLFNNLEEVLNRSLKPQTKHYLKNLLTNNYFVSSDKGKYLPFLKEINNRFELSDEFIVALNNNQDLFLSNLKELISYGLSLYKRDYEFLIDEQTNFALYKKYSYEDVVRLLDWKQQMVSLNISGYKHDKETNTFPIFVNYHKDEGINTTIQYLDKFKDEKTLEWFTKNKRNLNSPEVKLAFNHEKNNCKFHLFVRKDKEDKEGKEFYYLGLVKPNTNTIKLDQMSDGESVVKMDLELNKPVRNDIFEYIVKG